MKNKSIIIIIIVIMLGLLSFAVIKYLDYAKKTGNDLEGYYKLEKVISYYKIEDEEKTNEQTVFYNDRKLNIMVDKIESKILNTSTYYYLVKDNQLFYSLNEIDKDKFTDEKYYEYELNNEYLIFVRRNEVTETYYYKRIKKEEY